MTSPADRIVALALAILGFSTFALAVPASADAEPNDSFLQAEEIGAGSHPGRLSENDTADVYRVSVPAGHTVRVGATFDWAFRVTMYDASGQFLDFLDFEVDDPATTISWTAGSDASVLLKAEPKAVASVNYTLRIELLAPGGGFPSGTVFGIPAWALLLGLIVVVIVAIVAVRYGRKRP